MLMIIRRMNYINNALRNSILDHCVIIIAVSCSKRLTKWMTMNLK